jgi:hypothetical protein
MFTEKVKEETNQREETKQRIHREILADIKQTVLDKTMLYMVCEILREQEG